jgi:DNA-binding NarL/FixJ family response regulator
LITDCTTHIVADIDALGNRLATEQPDILILDQTILVDTRPGALALLLHPCHHTRVLLMEDTDHRIDQIAALKAGVCGYCSRDADLSVVLKAVAAIARGEVWIPRHLVPHLIRELAGYEQNGGNTLTDEQRRWLESLTARELEVARMVCQSANNKMIARELKISERTVKAHLSAVFKKLRIANRIRLALFLRHLDG